MTIPTIIKGFHGEHLDLPDGAVTIDAVTLLELLTLAERIPFKNLTELEVDAAIALVDAVRDELRTQADYCVACDKARNHPNRYEQSRACEDCEDGDTGGPYA